MPNPALEHPRADDRGGASPEPLPAGAARVAPAAAETGRSARKRQAIMEAATALFLRDGYRNTSMDQVAADAAVSKQTVYKQFADKEQLFRDIVLGIPQDRAQFCPQERPSPAERDRLAAEAIRVFLAAYQRPPGP